MKKECIFGIIGCVCFGIGDLLLGIVDPTPLYDNFSIITAGHGASYSLTKVSITIALGVLGMVFLLPGFQGVAKIFTDEKKRPRFSYAMQLCAISWLVIHLTVSTGIFVFSYTARQFDLDTAHEITLAVIGLFRAGQWVTYVYLAVALLWLTIAIFRGQTVLKKSAVFFSPLVGMAILSAVAKLLPLSYFAKALDTFSMNGAMIIWFVFLIFCEKRTIS